MLIVFVVVVVVLVLCGPVVLITHLTHNQAFCVYLTRQESKCSVVLYNKQNLG